MKNLSTLLFIGILFFTLTLTGCGNSTKEDRSEISLQALNSEEIGAEGGNYVDLRALLGNMTYKDLLELLNGSLNKLNALQAAGATTSADYQALYNIIDNLYNTMLEEKAEYESTGEATSAMGETVDALVSVIEIAHESGVGTVLNQIIKQTGTDLGLSEILAYILSADDATLEGLTKGLTIGSFESTPGAGDGYERFAEVLDILNGILDSDGKYATLHTDIVKLIDALKTNEVTGLDVGYVKDLVSTLLDSLIAIIDDDTTDDSQVIADAIYAALSSTYSTLYKVLQDSHNPTALANISTPMFNLLLDLLATNSEGKMNIVSLVDDIQIVWPILKGVVSIEDTDGNTMSAFITYLTEDNADGTDNACMFNIKKLLYKVLDLQNDTYNPGGELTDDTLLTGANGMLVHLLGKSTSGASLSGDGALYNFDPLLTLLVDITGQPTLLWTALDQGGHLIDAILGDESLSVSFLKAFVKPVDVDGDGVNESAMLEDILGLIHLDGVEFNGLLGDLAQMLSGIDTNPGTQTFNGLIDVLGFVIQNATVQ